VLAAHVAALLGLAACGSTTTGPRPDQVSCNRKSQDTGFVFRAYGYPDAGSLTDSQSYGFYTCADGASYYVGRRAPTVSGVSLSDVGTSEITVSLPQTSLVDIQVLQRSGPRRLIHTRDPKHPTVAFAQLRLIADIPFIWVAAGTHRFKFVLVVNGGPLRPGRYAITVISQSYSTPSLPVAFDVTRAETARVVRFKE
jgi:hypothetical protein